jgi:hypothetical protein
VKKRNKVVGIEIDTKGQNNQDEDDEDEDDKDKNDDDDGYITCLFTFPPFEMREMSA